MKLYEYLLTTTLCLIAGYLVLMYGLVQPLQHLLERFTALMNNL